MTKSVPSRPSFVLHLQLWSLQARARRQAHDWLPSPPEWEQKQASGRRRRKYGKAFRICAFRRAFTAVLCTSPATVELAGSLRRPGTGVGQDGGRRQGTGPAEQDEERRCRSPGSLMGGPGPLAESSQVGVPTTSHVPSYYRPSQVGGGPYACWPLSHGAAAPGGSSVSAHRRLWNKPTLWVRSRDANPGCCSYLACGTSLQWTLPRSGAAMVSHGCHDSKMYFRTLESSTLYAKVHCR